MRPRRWPPGAGVAAGALATVLVLVVLAACGGPAGSPAGPGARPRPPVPASTAPAIRPAPAPTPAATPAPRDVGALPQTATRPADSSPALTAEAQDLWRAVVTGEPAAAMPAFFPEHAYEQIKALADDAADYQNRLVAHFNLDVAAAHRLLGPGAASATLVGLEIPAGYVRWVPPGGCYNRIGYWFVPGSRVLYREAGSLRSFGIAALDSWRGQWYVIHLGSEVPPAGVGVVDDPSAGAGSFGSPAGC